MNLWLSFISTFEIYLLIKLSAKPIQLFDSLCVAAGTLHLREGREAALHQIEKGKDVLNRVSDTIAVSLINIVYDELLHVFSC